MSLVLDWRRDDHQAVLERAGRHLRQGRLIALPTEAGYEAVASALHPDAVAELCDLAGPGNYPALVLGHVLEVFDWLPHLRGAGLRLVRLFWPGPLVLSGSAAAGIADRLPRQVRDGLVRHGQVALRLPDHDWTGALHRLSAEPLVSAPLPGFPQDVGQISLERERLDLIVDAGPSPFVLPPTVVQLSERSATVLRQGAISAQEIENAIPCHILFVCTGNTCRSPLAEALCRTLLSAKVGCAPAELPARGFVVQSAGLAAGNGNPATTEAVAIAEQYGADLRAHASQALSVDWLQRADRVFTMTWSHLSLLRGLRVPGGPTPQLLALDGSDVDDPIGGNDEIYRSCADQIWRHLNDRLPELLEA